MMDYFKVFDSEGTGVIPMNEFRSIMTVMGETLSQEECQELVKIADPDGNGVVNYEKVIDRILYT